MLEPAEFYFRNQGIIIIYFILKYFLLIQQNKFLPFFQAVRISGRSCYDSHLIKLWLKYVPSVFLNVEQMKRYYAQSLFIKNI